MRGGGERAESDKGESREETTPLAGEGEGDGKKVTHSPSDNVSHYSVYTEECLFLTD